MKRLGVFKRKGALIAVGLSVVLLSIGAVFAFNSDRSIFSNLFQLPTYTAEYKEEFVSPNDWKTCDETPKTVITTNKSNGKIKVRLSYEEYWRNKENTANLPLEKDGETLAIINFQNESDWTKRGNWYYYNHELEPNEATNSLLKSVTLNCDASLGGVNVCEETPTGVVCSKQADPYEEAKYHLNVTVQTTSGEFPLENEFFAVSINPNGGTFNGSTEIYTDTLQYGTVIDLTNLAYTDHELVNWTKNGNDTYTGPSITVRDDLTLIANWQSSLFHTITVNPNGGTFGEHTEAYSESIRQGTSFTLPNTEPTREDYLFDGWTINGEPLTNNTFTVTEDATILANWSLIVAQNGRTSKFYRSLAAAESEAQSGDTITLVRDDEEQFTNTKNITLDLNTHILTGSLTNAASGNITILNGEINNPDGTAVTNNGTLTMGINDYIDENTVNIESTAIRLIGTTTGLKQNGTFNYYDGFIEGDIALEGGYNDSPFYRKAFDDEEVHFFPFVDKSPDDNTKQRVILESSDLAVSKTKVGGDIYYYSLQDNINTSVRTGYKIYIAREDWSTGEPITVPENTDITIDLEGHTFTATDTIMVNGKLTVEDSHSTINSETGEVKYSGNIQTPQTTIINGELVMKNSRITGTTINDTIRNNATLTMRGGRLGATSGYVIQLIGTETYDFDNQSSLYSTSSSKAAMNVTANYIWDTPGKIYGTYVGVANSSNTTFTLNDGTIEAGQYGVRNGNVTVNGGTITVNNTAGRPSAGINASTVTINDGSISVTSTAGGPADCTTVASQCITGIEANTITVKGGSIYAKSVNNGPYTRGLAGTSTIDGGSITVTGASTLYGANGVTTMNGGNITVTGTNTSRSYEAVGIIGGVSNGTGLTINDGTINVTNTNGVATGFYIDRVCYSWCYTSTAYVNGGTITAHSENGVGRGGFGSTGSDNARGAIYISGGTISGSSDSNTSYGIYGKQNTVNNAVISGGTYGIYTITDGETILGNSADAVSITTPEITGGSYALYNGAVKYYDGVLRGGTHAYQEGIIKAIPDGKTYHIEESASYSENCWLVNAAEYLEVVGVGRFSSLAQAYDAITGDTGTIKVVESVTVEATLPSSPTGKNITFDLNGNQLTYTQPLINGGIMTIIDSDPGKTGRLHNPNTTVSAIANNGTLTIESGYISSANIAISNAGTVTMNGGKIASDGTGIQTSSGTVVFNDGTIEAGQYGVQNGNVTMNGGTITVNNTAGRPSAGINASQATMYDGSISVTSTAGGPADCTKVANQCITGIEANTITVKGGSIYAKSVNNGPYTRGLAGTSTIDGGSITVTGASTLYGANGVTTMNGGNITVTGTNTSRSYEAVGIIGVKSEAVGITINDGTINVTNTNGTATGFYIDYSDGIWDRSSTAHINGGTISATSENGVGRGGYGATGGDNSRGIMVINGGTISGSSDSNTSYGIYGKQNTVNNAVISGGTYGIYTITDGETILGNSADAVSITTPEITGGSYALYNGAVKYYDGVLRGGTKAYQDNIVKEIAENVNIHLVYQTIGGVSYDTRWLVSEYDVAQIVGGSRYKKLSEAIENVPANGTIELVADNYIFPVLNIPTGKEFTLDTKGFNIFLGNHIVNNGSVSIVNNTTDTIAINYHGTDYAIVNSENAALSIDKLSLDCYNGIQNSGTMTITKASIDADNIAIRNTGNMSAANNLSIKGDNYSLYTDGGALSVSDATIAGNYIYNNSGELELINSTTSKSGSTILDFITNKGTMKLNAFEATLTNEYPDSSSEVIYPRVLYNTGTLITSNNSAIKHTGGNPDSTFWQNIIALYNDGGNVQASDTTFEANGATSKSRSTTRYSYGIYNPTGTATITSGKALARDIVTSYGIWNGSGTIVIGTPESTSSPNYGRENADVSTTEPEITAIATNNSYSGIGVKNASGGRVEYYDGKISGNTAAFAEEPTVTEYFYEVCTELDTSTTPNLYTAKLFWMRDGQSSCAQN